MCVHVYACMCKDTKKQYPKEELYGQILPPSPLGPCQLVFFLSSSHNWLLSAHPHMLHTTRGWDPRATFHYELFPWLYLFHYQNFLHLFWILKTFLFFADRSYGLYLLPKKETVPASTSQWTVVNETLPPKAFPSALVCQCKEDNSGWLYKGDQYLFIYSRNQVF